VSILNGLAKAVIGIDSLRRRAANFGIIFVGWSDISSGSGILYLGWTHRSKCFHTPGVSKDTPGLRDPTGGSGRFRGYMAQTSTVFQVPKSGDRPNEWDNIAIPPIQCQAGSDEADPLRGMNLGSRVVFLIPSFYRLAKTSAHPLVRPPPGGYEEHLSGPSVWNWHPPWPVGPRPNRVSYNLPSVSLKAFPSFH